MGNSSAVGGYLPGGFDEEDFYCTHRSAGLGLLLGGYGVSLALFVLYFACETQPCHYTRRRESLYIFISLSFVPLAGLAMFIRKFALCNGTMEPEDLSEFLVYKTLQIVLIFQICQSFVWRQMHPSFFESRPFMVKPKIAPSKIGGSFSREIEETVSGILENRPSLLPEKALAPFIFCLLAFHDITTTSHMLEPVMLSWPFGWFCLLTALVVGLCLNEFSRSSQPLVNHLNTLVAHICELADKDVLNYIFTHVSIPTLMEVGGGRVIDMLTDKALKKGQLSILHKAILVDALQGLRFFSNKSKRAVSRILCSCSGQELTALKNMIDAGGNYQNLHHLVYKELPDDEIRAEILTHLKQEADKVRQELGRPCGIKVLSDIDDTLYSSGGKFPAGVDKKFPPHTIYPGCLSLFRILDKQSLHTDYPTCNLVFLSARPHVYKGVAEDKSFRVFASLVDEDRMHAMPTLLPGSIRRGLKAVLKYCFQGTNAWKAAGEYKHSSFVEFRELYREYDFLFFGDNGQGDLLAAQMMLSTNDERRSLLGSLTQSFTRTFSSIRMRAPGRSFSEEPSDATADDRDTRRSSTCPGELADASKTSARQNTKTSVQRAESRNSTESLREPRLIGALIHKVLPHEQALAREAVDQRGDDWEKDWGRQRLWFHEGYLEAAIKLHESSPALVTIGDLQTVAGDALLDISTELKMHPEFSGLEACRQKLEEDLARLTPILERAGLPPLVRPQTTPFATLYRDHDHRGSSSSSDSDGSAVESSSHCPCWPKTARKRQRKATHAFARLQAEGAWQGNLNESDDSESRNEEEHRSSSETDGTEWHVFQREVS